jgi:CheY-like chemotaxis protein
MDKVLIAEDGADFRESLAHALFQQGYRVKTASQGREAIQVGSRFRPDVLVADWILGGPIDGLAVADALRVVQPRLASVLISGYVSRDLRERALGKGIQRVLGKPFPMEDLQRAVRDALSTATAETRLLRVAAVEIDADGDISFLNEAALPLFRHVRGGALGTRLVSHFRGGIDLEAADRDWVEGVPDGPQPGRWFLAAHLDAADGSRILLLHPEGAEHVRRIARVRHLLGREPEPTENVLYPLHVLVVDANPYARHRMTNELSNAGAICHGTADPEDARRLFDRDPEIGLVLLDLEGPGESLRSLTEHISGVRPGTVLVGTADPASAAAPAELGVRHVLSKAWQLDELIDLLREN